MINKRNTFKELVNIQLNPYHLVTRSPWPFYVSVSLGFFLIKLLQAFSSRSYFSVKITTLFFFLFFFSVLFMWFYDIKIESLNGYHTKRMGKNLRLGFFLMIISEIMFFFSFFWSLFHCSTAVSVHVGTCWPYINGMPPAWGSAWAGTMFLLTSSWWISESKMQFVFGSSKKSLYCITATLWCGAMFLFIQQWEFLSIPLTINQACSASLFFILTGFHCLHVILGMLFILNLYYRIIVHKFFVYRQKSILFDITIWYWHFVDYVWIFLFLAVYCYIG